MQRIDILDFHRCVVIVLGLRKLRTANHEIGNSLRKRSDRNFFVSVKDVITLIRVLTLGKRRTVNDKVIQLLGAGKTLLVAADTIEVNTAALRADRNADRILLLEVIIGLILRYAAQDAVDIGIDKAVQVPVFHGEGDTDLRVLTEHDGDTGLLGVDSGFLARNMETSSVVQTGHDKAFVVTDIFGRQFRFDGEAADTCVRRERIERDKHVVAREEAQCRNAVVVRQPAVFACPAESRKGRADIVIAPLRRILFAVGSAFSVKLQNKSVRDLLHRELIRFHGDREFTARVSA